MLRNLRKEQGVSMILLIVIIVIMVIIFAVSFSTSKDLIDSTKAKKYATIMYLIQGEITTRQEEAEFVAGEDAASIALARSMYIGTKLDMNNATVRDNLNNILSAEVNKNEYDQYYNAANAHGKYNEIKDYWYILTKNDLQKVGIETDFADNAAWSSPVILPQYIERLYQIFILNTRKIPNRIRKKETDAQTSVSYIIQDSV